ncbi:MAG: hypothetical protein JXA10_18925, partial [Anaerolineae bacterium]|nr:hypothetical protein [Anaerolineae bacterium]
MLRLTLPKIGLSVVVAAVIAFVISTVLDRGDRAEDNPVIVHSVMSNNTADQAPLGLQAAQYDEIPGPGALFMIQGQQARQLVFWPLYGDHDPEVIDSKISANTLRPDPTGTRVLYST